MSNQVILKNGIFSPSCRRDQILGSPELDIEALAQLVTDYEAANLACAAADLRRRLEWYRSQGI